MQLTWVTTALLGTAAAARPATEAPSACTTGAPVVTAGYTINYAPATPTAAFAHGFQPAPGWAGAHLRGSYTFGCPEPIESGFAYSQFKCQFYCGNQDAGSFYVRYAGSRVGSYCNCYDELLDASMFVDGNETVAAAWNSIC
ncbi:hypothetical protein F4780DRAFT_784464 [Xylariomycetidae sp. FL0641]|nr:hypothetical protein F4780DRAFT_784464 [Xylariomycetidae sp. FL0641]